MKLSSPVQARSWEMQATQPLEVTRIRSASAFRAYLEYFELVPLDVAINAGVRYLTVWNVLRGNPILPEQARKLRRGLLHITGIPFNSYLLVRKEEGELRCGCLKRIWKRKS